MRYRNAQAKSRFKLTVSLGQEQTKLMIHGTVCKFTNCAVTSIMNNDSTAPNPKFPNTLFLYKMFFILFYKDS